MIIWVCILPSLGCAHAAASLAAAAERAMAFDTTLGIESGVNPLFVN